MNATVWSAAVMSIVLGSLLHAQSIVHTAHVVDNGGGVSSAGGLTLHSSIGQPASSAMTANGFVLQSGYIPVMRSISSFSNTVTFGVPVLAGWNIVSLPVSSPTPDDSVRHVFENSVTPYAFAFNNGYQAQYLMQNGIGYWIKSSTGYTQDITGTIRDTMTIPIREGWNMIGSISTAIDTSLATPTPAGLLASNFFKYNNGYSVAATIDPGAGYWVKASGTGVLFLHSAGSGAKKAPENQLITDALNSVTITDASGGSQTLFFGTDTDGEIPVNLYVMPPVPPVGSFDARFESSDGGTMVQAHAGDLTGIVDLPIAVRSTAYPLTISWDVQSSTETYELNDDVEGAWTLRDKGTLQIKLPSSDELRRLTLRVTQGGNELPKEFALSQNYPNPFNPSTIIEYALPHAAHVQLRIYNILGQETLGLVNEMQPPGYHKVRLDAPNLASGVYFCKFQAGSFIDTKKLMLLR